MLDETTDQGGKILDATAKAVDEILDEATSDMALRRMALWLCNGLPADICLFEFQAQRLTDADGEIYDYIFDVHMARHGSSPGPLDFDLIIKTARAFRPRTKVTCGDCRGSGTAHVMGSDDIVEVDCESCDGVGVVPG